MNGVTDFERRQLLWVANHLIRELDGPQLKEIAGGIIDAFEAWKQARTDANGLIPIQVTTLRDIAMGRGLLSLPPTTTKLMPAESLEPWQCAGPDIANAVDLAFMLWFDGFLPFVAVHNTYGHARVFALIGLLFDDVGAASIIRLNRDLTLWLADESLGRQIKPLVEGRKKATKNRKDEATIRHSRAHQMATDFFVNHPDQGKEDVIKHLKLFDDFKKWKGKSSLERAVKGAKKKALEVLAAKNHQDRKHTV